MDLISIITPLYNSSAFIAQTIESVQNQSYKNWELIIVDDVSTDNSCEIVSNYSANDKRIKLIRSPINQGPAKTRNTAIDAAKGSYIAFLDSDDLWLPEKLEKQINHMKDTKADLSYTSYQWMNEDGNTLPQIIPAKSNASYFDMLNFNQVGCLTAIYDTKNLGKQYFTDAGHEDYILWLSIIKSGHIAKGLNENLAKYRIRQGSVSKNKIKTARFQWNIYRNIEQLSFFRSLFHFTIYTTNGVLKTLKSN